MFESTDSWSLPAHLFMVSEWSAFCGRPVDPFACRNEPERPGLTPDVARPPGVPPQPGPYYNWTDLTYLLHRHGISWRYYVFQGGEPDCEQDAAVTCAPKPQSAKTPGKWNPLPFFATVNQDHELGNIQSLSSFYA